MTLEAYNILISKSEKIKNKYLRARLRIGIVLLFLIGVRISELLPLKIFQVKTLFDEDWITIDRLKRGHYNHKAFLTPEAIRIIKAPTKDLQTLRFFKSEESFVFTDENLNKPLECGPFN
jgi:integrase